MTPDRLTWPEVLHEDNTCCSHAAHMPCALLHLRRAAWVPGLSLGDSSSSPSMKLGRASPVEPMEQGVGCRSLEPC